MEHLVVTYVWVTFHTCIPGLRRRSRQSKRISLLSSGEFDSRYGFSLGTHVKIVSQRSAESRGFSPGASVSSREKVDRVGLG
jgi:hypothetical protein